MKIRSGILVFALGELFVPALYAQQPSKASQTQQVRAAMEQALRQQRESILTQVQGQRVHQQILRPAGRHLASSGGTLTLAAPWRAVAVDCAAIPPAALATHIQQTADEFGISSRLLHAVAETESGFVPCAVSPKGAVGLMQIVPATGQLLGLTDPTDAGQSLRAGAKYLSQLLSRYGGNVGLALGAYNAGPGAVDKYGGIPPYEETQTYVRKIIGMLGTK
ncbi:MAG: lytic transglycosylase domain-containing protein [Acidobacteriota bacterium]